ncbi:hypothetical protein ABBQ38_008057 [Trebouxia sp. C0009 RCD-2024]
MAPMWATHSDQQSSTCLRSVSTAEQGGQCTTPRGVQAIFLAGNKEEDVQDFNNINVDSQGIVSHCAFIEDGDVVESNVDSGDDQPANTLTRLKCLHCTNHIWAPVIVK